MINLHWIWVYFLTVVAGYPTQSIGWIEWDSRTWYRRGRGLACSARA